MTEVPFWCLGFVMEFMKYSGIGGQAVIEGIMMRNRDRYAVAVRLFDGSIQVDTKGIKDVGILLKIPFVRGVYSFIMSLKLGISTLMHSASFFEEEEQESNKEKKEAAEKREMTLILLGALVFALLLFVGAPYLVSRIFSLWISSLWILNTLEGIIKFLLFLGYMVLISRMKDIQRTFMYHGAEHKCINCIEQGLDLTIENVRQSTRFHKRCGTSFLFLVIFISIIFHIFIQVDHHLLQLLYRFLLVPVIAGVAYECIRLAGRSDNPIIGLISKPGLMLQHITTIEPEDDMIEVGIASVEAVFDWITFQQKDPKPNTPCQEAYEEICHTLQSLDTKEALTSHPDGGLNPREAEISNHSDGLSQGEASQEADLILEHVCGITRQSRHTNPDASLTFRQMEKVRWILQQRKQHRPLQQILKRGYFYGHEFFVNNHVLAPRNETEELVQEATCYLKDKSRILDLCTGSGAILLSLALYAKEHNLQVEAVGTDILPEALLVAKENKKRLQVPATFIESDLFKQLSPKGGQSGKNHTFDLITANPPYIPSGQIANLMPEVQNFEPRIALDGGADGLDLYRRIAKEAGDYLAKDGVLLLEIGYDQGDSVPQLLRENGFLDVTVKKDLQGLDRVVIARRKPCLTD